MTTVTHQCTVQDYINSYIRNIWEMDKVAKGETESKVYSEYNEQYQIIAWVVLLLLLLEFCILERKNGFFAKFKLFD